jgi:alpha-mannosidase
VPVRICTEHRCATQDHLQTGPQCLGEYTFEYAVYPHDGDVWAGNVYQASQQYLMEPLIYQLSKHDNENALLPLSKSFLTIEPVGIEVSAFKKAQDSDACVLRLYNPSGSMIEGKLKFAVKPKTVELVTLNEELLRKLVLIHDEIGFEFEPFKIVTFRLTF